MRILAFVLALVLAACSVSSPAGTEGLDAASLGVATPGPIVEPSLWPPESTDDPQFAPITSFNLRDDGRGIELEFIGAREYSPDDPCSAEYTAVVTVVDGVLEVGVTQLRSSRPAEPPVCDAAGHLRRLEVELDEPFGGTTWRDLHGPYLHFLAPPDGLVQLTGLPDGWGLRAERDVEDSPTGRWERTYSPDASLTDETKRVVLYQSFDGPVNVTGGEETSSVTVDGQPATLYRLPANGELVLVWRLGNDGLALVAYEQEFSIDELIELAESAVAPASPALSDTTWGPLAVLPPQDGMNTLRAEGPIRIAGDCVYLEAHGLVYLLLWHADQVTWNDDSRTITFKNFPWNDEGRVVAIGDGDVIVVGGSGGGKGDPLTEGFVSRADWAAPPAPSCVLDTWWSVGALSSEEP